MFLRSSLSVCPLDTLSLTLSYLHLQVFVATPPNRCRELNDNRPSGSRYSEATFVLTGSLISVASHSILINVILFFRLDNLISRFEEPSSSARWDSPLITIASDDSPLDERSPDGEFVSKESEAVWEALTNRELKPPNLATQVVRFSEFPSLSRSSLLRNRCLSDRRYKPLRPRT